MHTWIICCTHFSESSRRQPTDEDNSTLLAVCQDILSNEFFDSLDIEIVNPIDEELCAKMKPNHSDVHREYYSYKLHDIFVGKHSFREFVFACFVRYNTKHQSSERKNVLISVKHKSPTDEKYYRFIFTDNEKGETVPIAKAIYNCTNKINFSSEESTPYHDYDT